MAVTNSNIAKALLALKQRMKDLPDPSVTLVGKRWHSPFLVLISCLLSLRTKDETTLPAAQRLFSLAREPKTMLRLSVKRLQGIIYPVGFYKTKARRIKEISRDLLARFNGQVPDDLDALLTLKGVGRKTANLVLIEGFGKNAMCVDTHVHRISNRFGYVKTKTPQETEMALREKLPLRFWREYNALLVTWGQNVCRPVSPRCSICPIKDVCGKVGVSIHR